MLSLPECTSLLRGHFRCGISPNWKAISDLASHRPVHRLPSLAASLHFALLPSPSFWLLSTSSDTLSYRLLPMRMGCVWRCLVLVAGAGAELPSWRTPVITRWLSNYAMSPQLVLVFAGAATAPSSRATLSLLSSLCSHFIFFSFFFFLFFFFFFFFSLEPLVSYYLTRFRVLVVFCCRLGTLVAWWWRRISVWPHQRHVNWDVWRCHRHGVGPLCLLAVYLSHTEGEREGVAGGGGDNRDGKGGRMVRECRCVRYTND